MYRGRGLVYYDTYITDKLLNRASIGAMFTDDSMYNAILKHGVKPLHIMFINDLYIQYIINEDWDIDIGMFSFRKGMLYEYGFNDYRIGNGIYSTITNQLQGVVLKRKLDYCNILIGRLYADKWLNSVLYINKENKKLGTVTKGTVVDIITIKNSFNRWKFETDLYSIDKYIYEKYVGHINMISAAFSYNTDDINGLLYYGLISYSKSNNNNISSSPTGEEMYYSSYYFGANKSSGYKYLIGIRKTFDIESIKKEVLIGEEYGYVNTGYSNLTLGKPIEPYNYALLGTTYNTWIGIRLNRNQMLKLRFCYYKNNGDTYYKGAGTKSTDTDNIYMSVKSERSITIQYYIDF